MPQRLILWRHAKSAYPSGVSDIDRPLSERGVRDALATRAPLRRISEGRQVHVLASPARRTLETWAWAGSALDSCDVEIQPRLYLAPQDSLLHEVTTYGGESEVLIVLAHDPGLHELVLHLAGSHPAAVAVREKFPTSAMAAFDVSGEWWDAERCSELIETVIPRG